MTSVICWAGACRRITIACASSDGTTGPSCAIVSAGCSVPRGKRPLSLMLSHRWAGGRGVATMGASRKPRKESTAPFAPIRSRWTISQSRSFEFIAHRVSLNPYWTPLNSVGRISARLIGDALAHLDRQFHQGVDFLAGQGVRAAVRNL